MDLDKISTKSPRKMLEKWYKNVLSEMSTVSKTSDVEDTADEDSFTIECYCIDAPSEKTLVVCALCGKNQHAMCVNFKPKPFQEVPYLCAHCWTLNEKIQCKATLIVVPQSILNQWIEEVMVFVYTYFLEYMYFLRYLFFLFCIYLILLISV